MLAVRGPGIASRSGRWSGFSPGLILVVAALSVAAITACRAKPSVVDRFEWQHPSPTIGGATLNEFMVTPLAVDEDGGLWFGYKNLSGEGGVGRFGPDAASAEEWQIHAAQAAQAGPGSGYVLALLPDGRDGVWVGSLHGGLSRYDGQAAAWQTITVPVDDVTALVADDRGLWLATFGDGIARYDPGPHSWVTYTQASTAGGLPDDEVIELIVDDAGGLWAGTYGGGLSHYDPNRDDWQAFTVASTGGGLGSNDIRALAADEAGNLWVGTFGGGISHYDPQRETWELYTTETTGGNLVSDYALTLLPGENGGLWAGLSNLRDQGGLGHFDGQAWQSYTVASTGGGLLSNDVRALAPDGAGGVWVGTRGGGLSHLAADRQAWTTFTVESTGGGLAGDTVLALLPNGAGGLWIGTASGLSHLRQAAP